MDAQTGDVQQGKRWKREDPSTAYAGLAPARPRVVYDTYWRFAAERQRVFFRRLEGDDPPLTDDPVLARYKFTNAYRASDRVSQYLIQHVLYEGDPSPDEIFFRTLLFKVFNRIETWELLTRQIGSICHADYDYTRYDEVLTRAITSGARIFSAAYIMPSGRGEFSDVRKHRTYLHLLETMMRDEVPWRIAEARSMRQAFEILHEYPLVGDFLAFQYVTDLNYSTLVNFSEMEFVVPGPGARDGIHKCFTSLGGLNEADIIRLVAERQAEEFARLGLEFRSLWGRPLQLIDCQNLFCEVDKYARIVHPDVRSKSGRSRIKQMYRPSQPPARYWYPPKWGINHLIPRPILRASDCTPLSTTQDQLFDV
jgi:5-hmdU DNA kinase-like protein